MARVEGKNDAQHDSSENIIPMVSMIGYTTNTTKAGPDHE